MTRLAEIGSDPPAFRISIMPAKLAFCIASIELGIVTATNEIPTYWLVVLRVELPTTVYERTTLFRVMTNWPEPVPVSWKST
jgi:hypothetical protein